MNGTIKDIEKILFASTQIDEDLIGELKKDSRKGVQKLLLKWELEQEKQQNLKDQLKELQKYERELRQKGLSYIAGIDEVGRGPLAGPVVAAAVILPETFELLGLTDSKKVTKANRELYYEKIYEHAITVGVGVVTASEIDQLNIYEATKVAMQRAVSDLTIEPEHLLIDAMKLPLAIEQTAIIKGDSKSISIAAASIIAKVTRDRMMQQLANKYPGYGFEKHMGYPTSEHLRAIEAIGVCSEHRTSFAPVRDYCIGRLV